MKAALVRAPRWSTLLITVAILVTGGLAGWQMDMPVMAVAEVLLLASLVLLWWPWRGAARVASAASVPVPEADALDVAMRTRLAAAQSELSSLRGVQRELLAAKQAAEAAMLAKSEFLASMSHEIRTPLNGILPLLDIVLGTELSPVQREYLMTANGSARELLRIVDDILDYSKAEAGKLDLESVSMNIREVVDGVKRLLEKPAEAKGLAMRAVVDADVRAVVRGDPVRVRQILTNLISNAIKFTQRGGVSVRVSRRNDTTSQHELLFAVRDTGIGLAPDAAARLFQPFTQADASVTRRYGGTGLGLTICKKLVDLMGGRIGVRSEPGRGSVFWFTIPFEKAPGDMGAPTKSVAGARTLLVASAQRAQALLPILAALELEASQLGDVNAALARLRQAAPLGATFSFDLLIVDVGSATGDTAAALRHILNDRQLDKLHLLALGLADSPDPRVVVAPIRADDATLRQGIRSAFGAAPRARAQPVLSVPGLPATDAASGQTLVGKVLLVEDHPVNQKVAQKLLERLGLSVDVADNGEIALEKLRERPYAMVLMDCQMPVLDGYSATRRLREIEAEQTKPRTPVIAMTAHAMAGDRERCLQAGMDDYLAKPLDRQLLERTVARWLQQSPHAGRSATPVEAALAPAPAPQSTTNPETAKPIMSSPPPDTLDSTTLADLEDIMGDELVTLIDAYLRDGETRMGAMRDAAARGDSTEVGKLAHSLKSSSANLGAVPLATRARQVEEAARSGTLANPGDSVAALEKLYVHAATALKERYKRT